MSRAESGEFLWASSAVIDDEIVQTPDVERALKANLLAAQAALHLVVTQNDVERALALERLGFAGYDALHLACAESGGMQLFLTTDDKLLKRAQRVAAQLAIRVVNPLQWLQEIETT